MAVSKLLVATVVAAAALFVSLPLASATVCGSFSSSVSASCSFSVPSGAYVSATTCPSYQVGAASSGAQSMLQLSRGTSNIISTSSTGFGSCPGDGNALILAPYRVTTSGTHTITANCFNTGCSGTVSYHVSVPASDGTCGAYGTCGDCTNSPPCRWCAGGPDNFCTSATGGTCTVSTFGSPSQCSGTTVINSGGTSANGVTAGTVIKVVDMPGSAAPIAGFVIGILFLIVFFAVIYYYQTRDVRAQKAAAALQAKQLEEATKKAAESQSPNSAARLQAAVAVQASQPTTGVVSPNMVVVQPAQPQPTMVMVQGQQPMQPMQMQPMQPQAGQPMQFVPQQQPMQGQPMQFQPMQPGQSGGMQFVPQQQPMQGQPMQFQPTMQPMQPGQSGGMQFVPQQPQA